MNSNEFFLKIKNILSLSVQILEVNEQKEGGDRTLSLRGDKLLS